MMLYVNKEPHKALELLAYQHCICEAASQLQSPSSSWLLYDRKFRMAAALDSTLPWGKRHPKLWLECFTAQQPKPQSSSVTQPPQNQPRTPCHAHIAPAHHTFLTTVHATPFVFMVPIPPPLPLKQDLAISVPRPPDHTPSGPSIYRDFNGLGCKRQPCSCRHQCSDCGGFHSRRDCPPRTSRP